MKFFPAKLFASKWYDLSTDERHQAYKGIATEYNTTHQVVGETAAEILSYQGGVVESLYAATQVIVDNNLMHYQLLRMEIGIIRVETF